MATTALSRLRAMLAYPTGTYISASATGAGAGDGTTVVSTDIVKYDANTLKNRWLLLTSGTYSGQARRISSVSSSTITVTSAFGGQVASAVTFEVVPWDPAIAHAMLQQAMRTLYSFPTSRGTRGLFLNVPDETLVTDQRIATNHDFETAVADSEITGWTRTNSPTLTSITTAGLVKHGTRSLRIVAGGSVGRLYQAITLPIKEAVSKTVSFRCWTYATAASTGRIGLSFDNGSNFTYSDYHGGSDEWEDLDVDAAVPADADSVRVYLEVVASGTAHFDLARAWCGKITDYTLPTSIIGGPYSMLYQVYEDKPTGTMEEAPYRPYVAGVASGRILRLEGIGRLTVPTTDAGTVEVDENRAELIVAQAAVYLFQNPANTNVSPEERRQLVKDWQERVAVLKESPGIAMHLQAADERRYWSIPPRDTKQFVLVR